jgi:perosamine synthetase
MDPKDVEHRITTRTRAILRVHYAGYACDLDELQALAQRHSLAIVEDAAHAFGSDYQGRKIGSYGNLSCFSFGPVKNITCGEGGAIATDSDDYHARLLLLRNLGISVPTWQRMSTGSPWVYSVDAAGYRYALPNLNAAIGLAQFDRLPEFRERKREATHRYDEAFRTQPGVVVLQKNIEGAFPYSYVIRVLDGKRDALVAFLAQRGIGTSVHYIPNHLQPEFASLGIRLPVTEKAFSQVVSLPLFSAITPTEVETVIDAVAKFFTGE